MKRSLLSLCMVLAVAFAFKPTTSHALVGVIFANKTIKTIGAVGALTGGAVVGGTLVVALSNSATLATLSIAFLGIATGGLGLIVLDDNTLLDIEFKELDNNQNELAVTKSEIEIYNSELALLNMIRKTIISETNNDESTDDAEKRWLEYSEYLHPATFKVAQQISLNFLKQ